MKIKDTIVECDIDAATAQVVIADGSMAVETVHLVVGLAGQQTDFHRVHGGQR